MRTTEISVHLLDHMGSDLTVVNAARVSFDKESKMERGPSGTPDYANERLSKADAKLVKYLAEHNHWTVFGHCFAQFRVKAPIFVARQLVKHQVGLVWNEVSRRYVDTEPEFWFPKNWRGRPKGSIKQGSSGIMASGQASGDLDTVVRDITYKALNEYRWMIEVGVAPEMARMMLPLNAMTEWYWSGSLAAWARVCNLRLDSHAQVETQEVAKYINDYMLDLFPVSWNALIKVQPAPSHQNSDLSQLTFEQF